MIGGGESDASDHLDGYKQKGKTSLKQQ